MKFLADMGVSRLSVSYLRQLGHDAVHIHEQGLDRLPDTEILEKARSEGRIVLTNDLDFGDLLAASGATCQVWSFFDCQICDLTQSIGISS